MTDGDHSTSRKERSTTAGYRLPLENGELRAIAGGLALVVAIVHLVEGWPNLVYILEYGIWPVPDPRPPVFVLSAIAIVAGVIAVIHGVDPKPIYVLGIALMVAYLGGYVAWHTVLDHGGFWPWGHEGLHHHDVHPLVLMVDHLLNEPLELLSKVAELAVLFLLAVLYRRETA